MGEITKAEIRQKLGNISQLQDLLFGEEMAEFNQKFREHTQTIHDLEARQEKFQLSIEERINQLENQLTLKIDSVGKTLEKKLKYLKFTTQDLQDKLQQDLNSVSQYSYKSIDSLQNNLKIQANDLRTEITQSKASSDRDLKLLKQQVMERLESSLTQLSTGKVSRSDLAEVLFELCLKLKEPSTDLELSQNLDNGKVVELVLQEQQSSVEHQ